VPPEYMEYHEKQQRAEVDAVREARDAALSEGGLPVSANVSEAAVHSAIRVEERQSAAGALRYCIASACAKWGQSQHQPIAM
jgi:hypothetical protein